MESLKKYSLLVLLVLASALFSLTSFYSIGYIILIALLSLLVGSVGIFKSFVQKFVLFTMLLTGIIPVVGILCWLIHTPMHPIYNQAAFILTAVTLFTVTKTSFVKYSMSNFIDKIDIIALAIAAVPIVIIALSFGNAPNRTAALFQLSSEGWDNGSHILMMETDSAEKGYVYGQYDELKDKVIEGFNAYPQSWHLTSSHLVNGFGGNRFNPHKPMDVILAYTILTIIWLILLVYVFTLCMWRFYQRIAKDSRIRVVPASVLIVIAILATIVVFVAAFMHGFTNYIGTLVYICLAIAMTIAFTDEDSVQNYSLFVIFSLAAILSWFLVLPAFALALILLILARYKKVEDNLVKLIRDWRVITVTVIAGLASLFQLYIFQRFSGIGSAGQLNEGSLVLPFDMTGSPLHISHVLYGFTLIVFLAYLYRKVVSEKTKSLLLAITVPWLALVIFVYIYQNITAGQNSYYLTKVMGLSLIAILIPMGAMLAMTISKLKIPNSNLLSPVISFLAIFAILLGTGQPLYGLNKMFQRNARTTYGTAEKIVEYLPKTTEGKAYIVVLTGRKSYENSREDNHGKLEIRVVHQPLNCTYTITGYISIKTAVKRLAECADQPYMKHKTIYVLTSPASYPLVKDLKKPNIVIKNT